MNPAAEPKRRPGAMRRFFLLIRSNWISTAGALLAFFGIVGMVSAVYLQLTGYSAGPYDAIVTFLALPILVLVGLLMIPAGLLVYRKRLNERLEQLADRPLYLARAVAAVTIVNLAAIAIAGQQGMHFVSSNTFCGTTCHVQMEPEHVTFQDSSHAQVKCVDCHIGPTAQDQISAKMNGMNQLLGVIKGDWRRPIPTPVHNLPSGEKSCARCHWPEKYLGVKLVVHSRFRDDEKVTGYTNVLLMRTGGTHPDGKATGIHWHTNPRVAVEYVASDEKRMQVPWVKSVREDGTERVFTVDGVERASPPSHGELRRMDCADCHNRAAHHFDDPGDAVDRAIAAGMIPRTLPFVKKTAVEVLRMERSRASAESGISESLRKVYTDRGLLDEHTTPMVDATAKQLAKIWLRNIYPDRGQLWNIYTDLKSHQGCFRCHDGNHKDATGEIIPNRCDACHVVLSQEEEDPAILGTLGIGGSR